MNSNSQNEKGEVSDNQKNSFENNNLDLKQSTSSYSKQLKDILSSEYLNMVQRLNLTYVPQCISNPEYCKKHHENNLTKTGEYIYGCYVNPEYPQISIGFFKMLTINNRFPSDQLFLHFVRIILNTTDNEISADSSVNLNFEKNYILEISTYLNLMLLKFPPCWKNKSLEMSYLMVINQPIDINQLKKQVNKQQYDKKTVPTFVISEIYNLIFEYDEEIEEEIDELKLITLDEYEDNFFKQYLYYYKTRKEKLTRLFIILEFLTKLMEMDLASWMVRNYSNPTESMLNDNKPICAIFFGITDISNEHPSVFLTILDIFVLLVAFSYPKSKIDVLSRLVALYCMITQLLETTESYGSINYPRQGKNMQKLAKFILRKIENSGGFLTKTVINVIMWINVPEIKYLVINEFLSKFDDSSDEISPQKVSKILKMEVWKKFCIVENEYSEPLSRGLSEQLRPNEEINDYPTVIRPYRQGRRSYTISERQYLDLLLEGLIAYCDHFAIGKFTQIFKVSSADNLKKNVSTTIRKPCNKQKNFQPKNLCKTPRGNNYDKTIMKKKVVHNCNNIFVDLNLIIVYRNYVKYLMIILKYLETKREDKSFKLWLEYFEKNIFIT